jgi:hypothetical protein
LKLNENIVKDNGQKKTYDLDPVTNFGQVIDLVQANKKNPAKRTFEETKWMSTTSVSLHLCLLFFLSWNENNNLILMTLEKILCG